MRTSLCQSAEATLKFTEKMVIYQTCKREFASDLLQIKFAKATFLCQSAVASFKLPGKKITD
jgi:hypothetical protein